MLTTGIYTDVDDHDEACKGEFGSSARVADWDTDLGPLTTAEIDSLMRSLHINTTFNKKNYFVTLAGEQTLGGIRAYFFEKHDGKPPGNWAVHDMHGNITLGSWMGITGPVLCARGATPTGDKDRAPEAVCERISAKRVFDVQWSGAPHRTSQYCSYFDEPYYPHKGRISVDRENDYFTLSRNADGTYSLRQYGADGTLKTTFPDGKVTLASVEVIFYIIDGFFGTVITSIEHRDGDSASYGFLTADPSPKVLRGYCKAPEKVEASKDCITACRGAQAGQEADCDKARQACNGKCSEGDLHCEMGCIGLALKCKESSISTFTQCTEEC